MFSASKQEAYEPLRKEITDEPLNQLDGEQSENEGFHQNARWSRYNKILLILNLLLTAILSFVALTTAPYAYRKVTIKDLAKLSSSYSPLLDRVDLSLQPAAINDIHVPGRSDYIYPQGPGPESDKFWQRVSEAQVILISTDDVVGLGKDPNSTARAPTSWGYGPDKHFAAIDSIHQIHCLDSLRQYIYFDHYFSTTGAEGKAIPPPGHMAHINHCIHNLLGNLMCSANVDLITFQWDEGQPHPAGDFVVNKQCRNFEEVLQYQAQNKVDKSTYMALKPE